MTPVDQSITDHNPTEGRFGDCFRACIATILDLPIEHVPHTMAYDERSVDDPGQWYGWLTAWLAERGLTYMEIRTGDTTPARWLADLVAGGLQLDHVISGQGPRGHRHCVVGRNGTMVHDPHPSRAGLVGPDPDPAIGWTIGLLLVGGGGT